MTLLVTTPTVGLEQIRRAMFLTIFDSLNDVIGQVEAAMQIEDENFAERTGRDFVPLELERVDPDNFYEGHRPSLIKAPVERYPNVAIVTNRANPTPENNSLDQLSSYNHTLFVELMVKSLVSEEEVNRRITRMTEAVNLCVMGDPTLQGAVSGFENAPSIDVSDVFTRKERTSYGPLWFWQGARISYAVRKEAVVHQPSPAGSFFRSAGFDIDQA